MSGYVIKAHLYTHTGAQEGQSWESRAALIIPCPSNSCLYKYMWCKCVLCVLMPTAKTSSTSLLVGPGDMELWQLAYLGLRDPA